MAGTSEFAGSVAAGSAHPLSQLNARCGRKKLYITGSQIFKVTSKDVLIVQ